MTEHAVVQLISNYRYCGIFFLLIFGIIGLPVPDEWLLVISGYLAFKNVLGLYPTLLIAGIGSVCGLTAGYVIGRTSSDFIVRKYGRWLCIDDAKVIRAGRWFQGLGRWVFIIGPFIPGMRNLVGYLSGATKLRLDIFMRFAFLGGLISSTTFVTFGYLAGSRLTPNVSALPLVAVAAVIALAFSGLPYRMAQKIGEKFHVSGDVAPVKDV